MKSRILSQLRALGWNRRVLTHDDFEHFCEVENILLIEAPLTFWRGVYYVDQGRPVITLDSRLRGPDRLLTAWHEAGHHLFHTPGHFGHPAKTEREADIVAHIALIPVFLLQLPDGEIQEMFGYSSEIIAERVHIFRTFNL